MSTSNSSAPTETTHLVAAVVVAEAAQPEHAPLTSSTSTSSLPASAAQQAPPPVVLRKKATSLVSRLLGSPHSPSRRNGSSSSNASSTMSRTSSQTNSRRTTPPTMIATATTTTTTASSSTPVSAKKPPPETVSTTGLSSLAPSWSRFRRQSTTSTFLSQSMMLESTEVLSDEELVLFETMSSKSFEKQQQQQRARSAAPQNALQWLGSECPIDVLPQVLAFCGPQTVTQLNGVNRFWKNTIQQESTWRVLCQELYKWKPGDVEPDSWKAYYRENPCVPIDYKTIQSALNANEGGNVHVWLRPGRYYLKESICMDRSAEHKLAISTMRLPNNLFQMPPALPETDSLRGGTQRRNKKRRNSRLLKFILCTGASYNDAAVEEEEESVISEQESSSSTMWSIPQTPTRATLILRTRKMNQPVVRVQQGEFTANDLNIEHSSHGLDIWNGNAAIQIQPPQPEAQDANQQPVLRQEELPVANLNGLKVSSRSGRGVVTIDGGQLNMKQSRVHECAATGVYIGGRGTRATVVETDVLRNGLGSRNHTRRGGGIARGHSGIYLEQGLAEVLDCNVSNNTLTGITAVSVDNATLHLRDTDLQGNGSFQLEIPARNSRNIVMERNQLESTGSGRVRASLH